MFGGPSMRHLCAGDGRCGLPPDPPARERIVSVVGGLLLCRRETNVPLENGAKAVGEHDCRPPTAIDALTRALVNGSRLAALEVHSHRSSS